MRFYLCKRAYSVKNWYACNDRGDEFSSGTIAYLDSPPGRKKVTVVREIDKSEIPDRKFIHWLYVEHRKKS